MNELQIGKAGEHLVCADLILKGFKAFLADQGSPFDLIAELDGRLWRVQVKTTQAIFKHPQQRASDCYRFGIGRGVGARKRFVKTDADVYAFVALDVRIVAYIDASDIERPDGTLKRMIEFRPSGHKPASEWRKRAVIDEYQQFPPSTGRFGIVTPACHPNRKHFATGKCGPCWKREYYLTHSGKGRRRLRAL